MLMPEEPAGSGAREHEGGLRCVEEGRPPSSTTDGHQKHVHLQTVTEALHILNGCLLRDLARYHGQCRSQCG